MDLLCTTYCTAADQQQNRECNGVRALRLARDSTVPIDVASRQFCAVFMIFCLAIRARISERCLSLARRHPYSALFVVHVCWHSTTRAWSREEIACVGRKIVAVFGESVLVSASWNASYMLR